MSNFKIKLLACLCMLIDHIGAALFPQYIFLRIIGRLAFPLFAWMIALGYKHTSDPIRYMKRLGIFALISQVPFNLALKAQSLNIFFTLLLGLIAIYFYDKYEKEQNERGKQLSIILPSIIATILNTDYFAYGIATIFLFYYYSQDFKKLIKSQAILNIALISLYIISVILGGASFELGGIIQLFSLFSLIIIRYYNEKQGFKKYKYAFYAFYPVHLLVIYFMKIRFF
ncbi:TraX family protein [Clostridium sp. BSD9I1]|uniref:TraX family protein n=1 Tax=Clostridium sp. BSD9I1 TaxID=2003589 RepID=UPI0016465CF4|nr:TraX family protein [Clostridium sp. BSD9I1]